MKKFEFFVSKTPFSALFFAKIIDVKPIETPKTLDQGAGGS